MIADEFSQKIEQLYSRLDRFYNKAQESQDRSADSLLEEAVEDLKISLEELRVAQEEMNQQHQALVAASQVLDEERQKYLERFEFAPDGFVSICHLLSSSLWALASALVLFVLFRSVGISQKPLSSCVSPIN